MEYKNLFWRKHADHVGKQFLKAPGVVNKR